jgi:hypothetical protein
MYGGNSNWRGPVWFPINYLVIRAFLQYDQFFGPEFTIDIRPDQASSLPLRDNRRRSCRSAGSAYGFPGPDVGGPSTAVSSSCRRPAWKDNLLFYEYFHGDNGAGLGPCIRPVGRLVADLLLTRRAAGRAG